MPETAIDATPEVAETPVDFAAALAKEGKVSDYPTNSAESNIKPEPQAPAEKKEPAKVEATKAEPVAEVPKAPTTPEAPKEPVQAQTVADWKEVLKKQSEHEVLKELGLDEKMVGLLSTWKSGGDVSRYLRETLTDYSKMTGEQLMRHQLKQDNPELTDEDIEELYQARVVDAYKLDANMYDEKEVKRGKLLLSVDAKKIREGLIAQQKQFILDAKPPESKADTAAQEAQERHNKMIADYQSELKGSPLYKTLTTDKVVTLEIDGQKFKYEVPDPSKIDSALFDSKEWRKMMLTPDGKEDVEKQFLVSQMGVDPKGFLNSIAKYFIGIGKSQAIAPIENLRSPEDNVTSRPEANLSAVALLAKNGVVVSG